MTDATHNFSIKAIPKPGTKAATSGISHYQNQEVCHIKRGHRTSMMNHIKNAIGEVMNFIDEDGFGWEDFNWSLEFIKLKLKPKPLNFVEMLNVQEQSDTFLKFHLVQDEDKLTPITDWYITFNNDGAMMRCQKGRPEDTLLDSKTFDGDLHLTFNQMTTDIWCIYDPEDEDETKSKN